MGLKSDTGTPWKHEEKFEVQKFNTIRTTVDITPKEGEVRLTISGLDTEGERLLCAHLLTKCAEALLPVFGVDTDKAPVELKSSSERNKFLIRMGLV
jgi:hypothetical protein